MLNFIEKLLPKNIAEEDLTGHRILLYYLCFTIIACSILVLNQQLFPHGDETPFHYIILASTLLVLILKYTGLKTLVGNIYIAIWAFILARLSLKTGGIYSMDTLSMSLVPLTGFALVNYKSGIGWLVFYLGYIFYLWVIIDSPELDAYFKAQTAVFDKDYYIVGSLIFAMFTFWMFFIVYYQNQKLLGQLKTNQKILKNHVDQLDKQSILLKKMQEDLKRSNNELEEFAYITSHDLKQPLHTVNSFANLLQSHLGRQKILDGETNQMLQFIIAGSAKMKNMITDLLAFAKLKKDGDVSFEKVNLDQLVNEVLFDLKEQIDTNEVVIRMAKLPKLEVIPVKINQLFQNLISNAIKFRKKDTRCIIHIGVKEQDAHWEFSIKDNGIGIPEEHHKTIFKPFKKLHNSAKYEGSGIGLASCLHIVKLHNGQIWINSIVGEGTTFYFTIAKDIKEVEKKQKKNQMVPIKD